MSCDWEGNRRSGVALAMRHRLSLSGLSTYGPTPPALVMGYGTLYLFGDKQKAVNASSVKR